MTKAILFFLFLISSSVFSQTENYIGIYTRHFDINSEGTLDYQLELKNDGIFTFHSYRKISAKNPEENLYGKGTWKVEKDKVIYFASDKEVDLDDKHTLDFSNTKARYITKSPRDKSEKEVKTHLRIYDSEIPWVKGQKFYKN